MFDTSVWRTVANTYSLVTQQSGFGSMKYQSQSTFAAVISSIFSVIPKRRDLRLFFNCKEVSEMSAALFVLSHLESSSTVSSIITVEMAQDFRLCLDYLVRNVLVTSTHMETEVFSRPLHCGEGSDAVMADVRAFMSGHHALVADDIGPCYPVKWKSAVSTWGEVGLLPSEFCTEYTDALDMVCMAKFLAVAKFIHFGWKDADEVFTLLKSFFGGLSSHEGCKSGACARTDYSSHCELQNFWREYRKMMNPEGADSKKMVLGLFAVVLHSDRIETGQMVCPCSRFHFNISSMCKMCRK